MRAPLFLFLLGASTGYSAIVPPPPSLTIGWVTESTLPLTFSPLGSASAPIVVDLKNNVIYAPASGCQFTTVVVCPNQPVLAMEILARVGHTNEVEWTTNLIQWTPSNVRWVSNGKPVRYYLPLPVGGRLYRLRESNATPLAMMAVEPTVGGLFSLSASDEPLPEPADMNWVVVTPDDTDAELLLDGSPSSDAENDPLEYSWEEGTNVFATDIKTTRRFPHGQRLITLKVSDGVAISATTAEVETIKASAAVKLLMGQVQHDDLANLIPRNSHPLLATLEAAMSAFERGNRIAGVNQLQAFQNQVRGQLGPLSAAATRLLQAAGEIIHGVTNAGTATATQFGQTGSH